MRGEEGVRDVTTQPTYKVFAVISKHYTDQKYTNIVKMDKSIDWKECCFSETIENLILLFVTVSGFFRFGGCYLKKRVSAFT